MALPLDIANAAYCPQAHGHPATVSGTSHRLQLNIVLRYLALFTQHSGGAARRCGGGARTVCWLEQCSAVQCTGARTPGAVAL